MKTRLGFLTEEGQTRSKNAFRRFCAYAVLMFLIAGAGGYGIHRYWVSGNLTLLQRVYFKQYMKSSWRSSLFNSRSHYTVLERTANGRAVGRDQVLIRATIKGAKITDLRFHDLATPQRLAWETPARMRLLWPQSSVGQTFGWRCVTPTRWRTQSAEQSKQSRKVRVYVTTA